jgi:protein O-mannosyl-transferase
MARPRLICLVLALLTLILYLPVRNYGYIAYDDDLYVTENRVVQAGLTWAGAKWAFTGFHASNWHPVTWLSHMLDCQLFGMNPGAHHLMNVLLHCANTVLLFLLLFQMTAAVWPATFVAALFAWHPLHVESVAWIAERKDVLSTFFALLSLHAYVGYGQERDRAPKGKLALALVCFALGLMSKPMLVTLPCVFLLLDYWPLKRAPLRFGAIVRLALEKWPFFVLTAASCVVTFIAQREEAMVDLEHRPLGARAANAIVAYATYLAKTVWPRDLAVIYPLADHLPLATVAVSAAVIIAISAFAWRTRGSRPYLLTGWLWFVGTLVPVIGLVQVGRQAMADRYTYLPLIGIFIAIVYGGRDLAQRFRLSALQSGIVSAVILVACAAGTLQQLNYWRDSKVLFARTVAVTKENDIARVNLGVALEEDGRKEEALAQYREALRINPKRGQVNNNIANLLAASGRHDEALMHYQEALRAKPNAPLPHLNVGTLLIDMGRDDEGMRHYAEAARLLPDDPRPWYLMAKALLKQNDSARAAVHFRESLRRGPGEFRTLTALARLLASDANANVRNGQEAVTLAERANALTRGEQPFVLDTLAMAYAEAGRFDEAQRTIERAIQISAQAGMEEDAQTMRQRLELYRSQMPYRESAK